MAEPGDAADAGTDPPRVEGRAPGSERPRSPDVPPELTGSEALERMADLLAGQGAGPDGASDTEGLVDELPSDDAWSALAVLHGFLDRRLARGELDAEECRELRRRLVAVSRALAEERVGEERRRSRRLLGGVAHDLRSTLNSVVFLVEALHSGHSGPLDEQQRRQVGIVYSAATSLLNLVNCLVDWAGRVGEGEREPEPFSLSDTLARVCGLARPIAESQGVRFTAEADGGDVRRGDPEAVTRVALNLVTNALAAAGGDGTVEFRLSGDADRLRLEVTDSASAGDEEISWLADLLEGSEPRDVVSCLEEDGYGTGLCICRQLVAEVGGTATVDVPEDRSGKRIVVSFPFPEAGGQVPEVRGQAD